MTQPDNKKDYRVLVFSVLMGGVLASVLAMYCNARPFAENRTGLDIATAAAIILITILYIMTVKGGIPLPGPKSTDR